MSILKSLVRFLLLLVAGSGVCWAQGGLSLDVALDEALKNSPRLAAPGEAVMSAEIQRSVTEARYHPRITPMVNSTSSSDSTVGQTLGLSVSQLLPTGATLQGSIDSTRYGLGQSAFRDSGYSITVSQPLFRGFGASDRVERQRAGRAVDAATRAMTDARQQLVINTAQAYFAVLRQQRLSTESERSLDRATKLEEMAEARARVGLSTQLDVFRAALFRSQARSSAMTAANQLAAAGEELNILLGRRADAPLTVRDDIEADLQIVGADSGRGGEVGDATRRRDGRGLSGRREAGDLSRRPDVADAREHVEDLRQQASLARWNMLPQMNLDVTYMRRGLFGGLFDSSMSEVTGLNGWRVGFGSTYSLNQRSDAAAAALAGIAAHGAERTLAEVKERAAVDVRRAQRSIEQADELRGLLKHALELAEQQRELATMRYGRGLADNLEVVDAENSVFQAQSAVISADIDRAMSVLLLQRATGTLSPDRFLK